MFRLALLRPLLTSPAINVSRATTPTARSVLPSTPLSAPSAICRPISTNRTVWRPVLNFTSSMAVSAAYVILRARSAQEFLPLARPVPLVSSSMRTLAPPHALWVTSLTLPPEFVGIVPPTVSPPLSLSRYLHLGRAWLPS